MKYLIISDIHGSYYYLNKVLKIFDENKCDKIIILGDILYHGPRNDLPKEYNPKKVISLLNELSNKIIAIKGNCDAEVDEMVLSFKLNQDYILNDSLNIYLTHGHHLNFNSQDNFSGIDIVLYGHTHVHKIEKRNNTMYINPGSISLAKEDLINSFAIMENNTINIYDFNMNVLLTYKKSWYYKISGFLLLSIYYFNY